jgi:hypothetical protein
VKAENLAEGQTSDRPISLINHPLALRLGLMASVTPEFFQFCVCKPIRRYRWYGIDSS